jgi:hypothetical protein
MTNSNLEILAYEPSPLGLLCLRRRELLSQPGTIVTEVTLNHEFLMSSLYTFQRFSARNFQQVNNLMEAIHEVLGMLMNWDTHDLDQLRVHLGCFRAAHWRELTNGSAVSIPRHFDPAAMWRFAAMGIRPTPPAT